MIFVSLGECHENGRLQHRPRHPRSHVKPMLIGYMRISKADGSQTTDLQLDALVDAGVDPENIYEDSASGAKDDRPDLAACLKALRAGDTLVVWKLDRLGRSLKHLVSTVQDLAERDVAFKVLRRS